jgi:UDP-GlcNAc:undecaprenyl-phosphate GlcNAc-1-phosphate transferase
MILYIIFFGIVNFFLFRYLNFFKKKLFLNDEPNFRKIHKTTVPLLGGTFFIINICIINLVFLITGLNFTNLDFNTNSLSSLILGTVFFYLTGYLDDKNKNLSPVFRLVASILILIFLLWIDSELILKTLKFSFLNIHRVILISNYLQWLLTIFCFLVLINSLNMIDGINLLSTTFIFFVFCLMYYLNIFNLYFICILPFFIFFFIYNHKYHIFFGSSGIMPSAFLIGYFFIKGFNQNIFLFSDIVFIILFLPLTELLRIMFLRIKMKQNPFKADQSHLHHYLYHGLGYHKSIFILLTIYIGPSLLLFLDKPFYYLVFFLLIYYLLIKKFRIKKKL